MAPGIEPVLTSSSERRSITSTFSPLSSFALSSSALVSLAVADRCAAKQQGTDAAAVQRELADITGVNRLEVLEQENARLRLLLTCDPATDARPEVYQRIRRTDWVLLDFHQETQSLENIFRELTKES